MKYMLLIYGTENCWTDAERKDCMMESMAIGDDLVSQGKYIASSPLHSVTTATSVRVRDGKRLVTDGPFAETTEQLGGYYIIDVENLDEAMAVACRLPPAKKGTVEIRPVFDVSDLRELPAPKATTASAASATIIPYLFFKGRCEEAIQFYQQKLNAQLEMVMKFKDSPDPPPPGMLPPGFEEKVMHASILIGGARLMVSDGCDVSSPLSGFRISLALPTEAEAHRAFEALATGGAVEMPLTKTFWSACFGMVTDQFEIPWMVSVIES
jgi:uncharacterized glyoxalase superfamily protein PhnB